MFRRKKIIVNEKIKNLKNEIVPTQVNSLQVYKLTNISEQFSAKRKTNLQVLKFTS
jgi:hypothetical protein